MSLTSPTITISSHPNDQESVPDVDTASSSGHGTPPFHYLVPFDIFSTVGTIVTLCPLTLNADQAYNIFESRFDGVPLTCKWYTAEAKPYELRGWTKLSPGYTEWAIRVAEAKGDLWKSWGIYDMILLSTVEVPVNLRFPLMGFGSTSLNTFVFPWGMLGPTLLDVAPILGLLAGGKEVHAGPDFSTGLVL